MAESHTVARTFLKGFAATLAAQPSGLVVYEKGGDLAAQIAAQTLTSAEYISTHTDFYMLVQEGGAKDPLLEESLSKIEQHWPSFARALRTPGVSLTTGQIGTLTAIAGLWEARSRRTVNALQQRFQKKISLERFKLQSSGLFGAVLERAIAAFVLEHFDLNVVHDVAPTAENWALAAVPELAKSNFEILRRLHIAVLTVTNPPEGRPVGFSTSDHPVAWVDTVNFVRDVTPCPIKVGANVEVTFPLSKTKCLLFSYAPTREARFVHSKKSTLLRPSAMLTKRGICAA
jgi:hypothetical protein